MSRSSQPGYKAWTSSLKNLPKDLQSLSSILVSGASSFLQLKTKEKLKRLAQQDGYAIESYQAEQLDLSSLYEIVEQDGLFH